MGKGYKHMKAWKIGWRIFCPCLFLSLIPTISDAQQPADRQTDPHSQTPTPPSSTSSNRSGLSGAAASGPRKGNPTDLGPTVRIGPGDDLEISVFGLPELSQHARVGTSGDVSLPLIGNLHLAGLSNDEAQALIEKRLVDGHFVNTPHVSVDVKEYTTEGISLMGEVTKPGVYSALGAHRLVDLIETAGGLTNKAGKTVTVAHRDDPEHPRTLILSSDAAKAAENNIVLLPGDTIVVSKAGIIYVIGEVNRPGGFVMEENKITASQVLVMAAGPTRTASLNGTKMIRHTPEGLKDIPLPMKKVLEGKIADIELQPDDIIWVPGSKGKELAGSTISSMISTGLSLAIYRF
jgi:polysaccharide export outer membrane protein